MLARTSFHLTFFLLKSYLNFLLCIAFLLVYQFFFFFFGSSTLNASFRKFFRYYFSTLFKYNHFYFVFPRFFVFISLLLSPHASHPLSLLLLLLFPTVLLILLLLYPLLLLLSINADRRSHNLVFYRTTSHANGHTSVVFTLPHLSSLSLPIIPF